MPQVRQSCVTDARVVERQFLEFGKEFQRGESASQTSLDAERAPRKIMEPHHFAEMYPKYTCQGVKTMGARRSTVNRRKKIKRRLKNLRTRLKKAAKTQAAAAG